MTKFCKCLPALLAATAIFVGGANEAMALCNPGSKNCISVPHGRPKFCNPCTIDGGLGSTCKTPGGNGQCGVYTGDTATTSQSGVLDRVVHVSHRSPANFGPVHSARFRR